MRELRSSRNREPNWKLAFGSGSFLLVWVLALTAGIPLPVALLRAVCAAALGACLGTVVGMTLKGLGNMAKEPDKGSRLDLTVPNDPDELTRPVAAEAEATRVVPKAASGESFTPIDLKAAARHVQGAINE